MVSLSMHRAGLVPVALLAAGIALVADAVGRGGASVTLFAIVPVVTGSSVEFLFGVVLLLVGFVTLPLAFLAGAEPAGAPGPRAPPPHSEAPPTEVGGLLLIGPVPIFFGRWQNVSRATKVAVAVAGAAALIVLVALVVLALGR
jgi:uncharacterized membrane protein